MKTALTRCLLLLLPFALLLAPEAVALKSGKMQEANQGVVDDGGSDNGDEADADTAADSGDSGSEETDSEGEGDVSDDAQQDSDGDQEQEEAATTAKPHLQVTTKKPRKKVPGELDVDGLSRSLKDGGVQALTRMLSAWKAARGNVNTDAQYHIKHTPDGKAYYDFHDLYKPAPSTTRPHPVLPMVKPLPGILSPPVARSAKPMLSAQAGAKEAVPEPAPVAAEPSPKAVPGVPTPDALMKQLLGALPAGMSQQIEANMKRKQEAAAAKPPQPATTHVAMAKTSGPAAEQKAVAKKPDSTAHVVVHTTAVKVHTTHAPAVATSHAAAPAKATQTVTRAATVASTPTVAAPSTQTVAATAPTTPPARVEKEEDPIEDEASVDEHEQVDIVDASEESTGPAAGDDGSDKITALSHGLAAMRMSLDTMIGQADSLAHEQHGTGTVDTKAIKDISQKVSEIESEVRSAMKGGASDKAMKQELAKQVHRINDLQAAQQTEAQELSRVEQENRKLRAEVRALAHHKHQA